MLGNEVANIISSGVLSILGALGSYGVAVGVTYLKKKRESLIEQMGVDQYNKDYKIAQDLYYVVEQQFKFIPQAGEQKKNKFDKLLIEKIPGISQEELDHFRETICGKINAEVKNGQISVPAFIEGKDLADVVETYKIQSNNAISEQPQAQNTQTQAAV